MPDLRCARCTAEAAGLVQVSDLAGPAAPAPVAELVLCVAHLAAVAVALGFEEPADVRAEGTG